MLMKFGAAMNDKVQNAQMDLDIVSKLRKLQTINELNASFGYAKGSETKDNPYVVPSQKTFERFLEIKR